MSYPKSLSLPPKYVEKISSPVGDILATNADDVPSSPQMAFCSGFFSGRSADRVVPVTYRLPTRSVAMSEIESYILPPKRVTYGNERTSSFALGMPLSNVIANRITRAIGPEENHR